MPTSRTLLLDLPYTLSLMEPAHRAVVSPNWGVQLMGWLGAAGPESPRLQGLDDLKEQTLWSLLLYENVLLANPTHAEMQMRTPRGSRPLSRDLGDLAELIDMGVAELVEPAERFVMHPLVSREFAQRTKALVVSDLSRDGVSIEDWEYALLTRLIGTDEKRSVDDELIGQLGRIMSRLEHEGNPIFRIFELPEHEGELTLEDVIERIPSEALLANINVPDQPSEKYYDLVREVLLGVDETAPVGELDDKGLGLMWEKLHAIEASCDRLARLFGIMGTNDADLKLDLRMPKVGLEEDGGEANGLNGLQDDSLYVVVSAVLDEVVDFPRLESVRDVRRHLGKPYISDLRETIFEWSASIAAGNVQSERELRDKVKQEINRTAKRVGKWQRRSVSLNAIQKTATAFTMFPGLNLVAGPIAIMADAGKDLSATRAEQLRQKREWLLFGND